MRLAGQHGQARRWVAWAGPTCLAKHAGYARAVAGLSIIRKKTHAFRRWVAWAGPACSAKHAGFARAVAGLSIIRKKTHVFRDAGIRGAMHDQERKVARIRTGRFRIRLSADSEPAHATQPVDSEPAHATQPVDSEPAHATQSAASEPAHATQHQIAPAYAKHHNLFSLSHCGLPIITLGGVGDWILAFLLVTDGSC